MRCLAFISAGLGAVALLAQIALATSVKAPSDSTDGYFGNGIVQSVERLKPVDRTAINEVILETKKKSYEELVLLRLSEDICQEIACRGASPELVRSYVQAQIEVRTAEAALSSSEEAKKSTWIAGGGLGVAILSLIVSFGSFRWSRPK